MRPGEAAQAQTLASRKTTRIAISVPQIKATVLAATGKTLREGDDLDAQAKAIVMTTDIAKDEPGAFMEKCKAQYKGA